MKTWPRAGRIRRWLVACVLALPLGLWASTSLASPFAYVSNTGSANVSVIDTASNTVVATVSVGTNPAGVAANPTGTRVYVANQSSNTVSVIDTSTNSV